MAVVHTPLLSGTRQQVRKPLVSSSEGTERGWTLLETLRKGSVRLVLQVLAVALVAKSF